MNDDSEGTPNPLNPGAEAAPVSPARGPVVEPAAFAETPANASQFVATSSMPEIPKATPPAASAMPEMKQASPTPTSSSVVDPMMRPATTRIEVREIETPRSEATGETIAQEVEMSGNNFDTLAMNETTIEELRDAKEPTLTTETSTVVSETPAEPDLVAKDSIVEPSGKGKKKKGLVIFAIVFLIIALGCGAAAVAIMLLNNNANGDRVVKAIEKLIDGGAPTIVAVKGNITASANTEAPMMSSANISFDGTFSTVSPLNTVSANITTEIPGGSQLSVDLNELKNEDGDTFFKISGLEQLTNPAPVMLNQDEIMTVQEVNNTEDTEVVEDVESEEEEIIVTTNCVNGSDDSNCLSVTESPEVTYSNFDAATGLLSIYGGLFEAIDDEWIMVPYDFVDSMGGLEVFSNPTTCLINAFGTLSQYGKDIANKYNANQFITYSTENLEIAKKKNTLYRLGFNHDKMTAFVNSLSNNGFINELNACAGNAATNTDVATTLIKNIFDNFPTVYVEVDDNYNFTRVYFKTTGEMNGASADITADLDFSYPAKIEVTEPESYIEMSELLNGTLKDFFSTGEPPIAQ